MRTLLLMIAELYGVEKLVRQRRLSGEDLRLLREQEARPVLEKLHAYLLQIHKELVPKSEAGQAVNSLLKNWTALTRYCENPTLSIDNNHTERSLRGWAVGRKCELVKVDPFAGSRMCSRGSPPIPSPGSTSFCQIAGRSSLDSLASGRKLAPGGFAQFANKVLIALP